MATAKMIRSHDKHLDGDELPEEAEKKLVGALIAISMGVTDPEKLDVPVDIGQELSFSPTHREFRGPSATNSDAPPIRLTFDLVPDSLLATTGRWS